MHSGTSLSSRKPDSRGSQAQGATECLPAVLQDHPHAPSCFSLDLFNIVVFTSGNISTNNPEMYRIMANGVILLSFQMSGQVSCQNFNNLELIICFLCFYQAQRFALRDLQQKPFSIMLPLEVTIILLNPFALVSMIKFQLKTRIPAQLFYKTL